MPSVRNATCDWLNSGKRMKLAELKRKLQPGQKIEMVRYNGGAPSEKIEITSGGKYPITLEYRFID